MIGGAHRGRKLHFPNVPGLRPTADRVRETLFNWLQGELYGRRVLDLFAGSGALGIEALSRDAGRVQFVERSRDAAQQLRENLNLLNAGERAQLSQSDAQRWLQQTPSEPFDLVLLDPPFADRLLGKIAQQLEAQPWLADGAWIYIEQDAQHPWPDLPSGWQLHREGKAGQAVFRLFKRQGDIAPAAMDESEASR